MENLLRQATFREQVRNFIRANIQAYVPGMESADSIKAIPNVVEVVYSRPLCLGTDDYATRLSAFEESVIRSQNLHTCEP